MTHRFPGAHAPVVSRLRASLAAWHRAVPALVAAACAVVLAPAHATSAPTGSSAPAPTRADFSLQDGRLMAPRQAVSVDATLHVHASPARRTALCLGVASLVGPAGAEAAALACDGDDVAVKPARPLVPGVTYTLLLRSAGAAAPLASGAFRTATIAGARVVAPATVGLDALQWHPGKDGDWHYAWGQAPTFAGHLLAAPAGRTAVTGRLARIDGEPLAGVRVAIEGTTAVTDARGRFLLTDVGSGDRMLAVDGTQVVQGGGHFAKHYLHVAVESGRTNAVAQPIFLARIDPRDEVALASPADRDVVLTHPDMPGVEVRIPKGTVLREQDGSIVTKVSLTPVPLDRAPYLTPLSFPMYFTLQPGGAYVDPSAGTAVTVTYPNQGHLVSGQKVDFWDYDPHSGWKVYGHGRAEGARIVAEAKEGLALREVMTFGFGVSGTPPAPGPKPGGERDGDPVDLATGTYVASRTDIAIPDVMPISISRTYQQFDATSNAFGGWTMSYDLSLYQASGSTDINVVLSDRTQIPFALQSTDVWKVVSVPAGAFYGATLTKVDNPNYAHTKQFQVTMRDQTKLRFDGDPPNQLLEIEDANGNQVTLTRDGANGASGKITRITSPNGRYLALTYTGTHVTQVTDNIGRTLTYGYDTATNTLLTTVLDADQTVLPAAQQVPVTYAYDGNKRLYTIQDKRKNVVLTNHYDAATGKLTQQDLPDGTFWKYGYQSNTFGSTTAVTNPRTYVTNYNFNLAGYTISVVEDVNGAKRTTQMLRDGNNMLISVIDPLNRTTTIGYDTQGNIESVTALANTAEAVTASRTFDSVTGRPLTSTNELNNTSKASYDSYGNLESITTAGGHTWSMSSNDQGLLTSISTPLGHTTSLTYRLGDVSSVTDAESRTVSVDTDQVGRAMSIADNLGNQTKFTYDEKNRPKTIVDATGQMTSVGYDGNGNAHTVLLPQHTNPFVFNYDALNRATSSSDPMNHGGTVTPDGNGNPKKWVDGKGQTTTYQFDSLDRPYLFTFNDNSTLQYTFDNGDNLRKLVDSVGGTTSIDVDDYDHPTSISTPYGAIGYQFDALGRIQSLTYPSGLKVVYDQYDADDNVGRVAVGSDTPYQLTYDVDGRLSTLQQPNGVIRTQMYYNSDLVKSITYTSGTTSLGDWQYSYDDMGRVKNITGALIKAVAPVSAQSATFDDANQIATLNGATLSTDNNGDQLTDAGLSFGYDARGRLTSVTAGTTTAHYTINPFGLRDTKTVGSTTTHYLYDINGHLLVETDAAKATQREYVWVGDLLVMVRVYKNGSATEYNVWTDHLNTPRVVADATNAIVWRWDSDAYGNGAPTGSLTFNMRFPGQYFDAESGLHYNAARDYNPKTGRYVERDPLGLGGGANSYSYAMGNPAMFYDPYGLWSWGDPLPQGAVDFAAGFGDSLSFGLTGLVRNAAGIGGVDTCSAAYTVGEMADLAFEAGTMGLSAGLKAAAKGASRDAARRGARPFIDAFREANNLEGGFVHHSNPLFGHPGGFPTTFPTGGLPAWLNSGAWNLRWFADSAAHSAAHRWMRALEGAWDGLVNPAMTATRAARDSGGGCCQK